jgi:hypothetical protein
LVNGILGSKRFDDGQWLGFEGDDFEAEIDLGRITSVSHISCSFLDDQNAWIFQPSRVRIFASDTDEKYKDIATIDYTIERKSVQRIETVEINLDDIKARFIKVKAKNIQVCPDWHKGAGGKAWLFIDEIIIK